MNRAPVTRQAIVEAAKELAREKETTELSRADFVRSSGISEYHIYRLFPDGGWLDVVELAGLAHHAKYNEAISDEALLTEFYSVASTPGRIPTWTSFAARASVSADTVRKRFGGLQGTLARYRDWLEECDPSSTLRSALDIRSKHEIPSPPSSALTRVGAPTTSWVKSDAIEYGPPISFRGLRHAPINEQGVVYLFGMVSYELGFLVDAVHTAYPDCGGKRCVDARRNRWQRVRIEFEYRSSNFREHGHDPAGCDIIVCWEHDWGDCPLEVLELRRVIDDLEG